MPKQLFKRLTPHPDVIKNNKYLKPLGEHIHSPCLWHFNRHSVSAAMAIGLFCMWVPIPAQSVLAAFLAIIFRANLPLSAVLVFITNPITMPPMLYFAYEIGAHLLGQQPQPIEFQISLEWFFSTVSHIWKPFAVGILLMAVFSSVVGYFSVQLFWRIHTQQRWKERCKRRLSQKVANSLQTAKRNSPSTSR